MAVKFYMDARTELVRAIHEREAQYVGARLLRNRLRLQGEAQGLREALEIVDCEIRSAEARGSVLMRTAATIIADVERRQATA